MTQLLQTQLAKMSFDEFLDLSAKVLQRVNSKVHRTCFRVNKATQDGKKTRTQNRQLSISAKNSEALVFGSFRLEISVGRLHKLRFRLITFGI